MKEHGTLVGRDCPESRCHLSSQAWIPSFASCRANSSTAGLSIVLLRKKDVERHLQFCSKRAAQIARASGCVFLAEPDPLFITSFKRDNRFYRVREGDLLEDLPSVSRPGADLKIGPLSPRFRMSVWDPLLEHLVLFFCLLIQEYCRMSHLAGNRHHDLSGERRT